MHYTIDQVESAVAAAQWCSANLPNNDWELDITESAINRQYRFTFHEEQHLLMFILSLE